MVLPIVGFILFVTASPSNASNDPFFDNQWGIQRIQAEKAWLTSAGSDISLAVVDTGVDLRHEDLENFGPGYDFVSEDAVAQDEKGGPTENCRGNWGHGSHVAGIAAAVADNGRGVAGVAPAAKLMPVRVLDEHGCGKLDDVIAGIRWAADNGAQVINLSIGAEIQFLGNPSSAINGFYEAIEYAWRQGAIVVLAPGHEGVFPSGYKSINAIVVGATNEDDTKAEYSNLGDAKWSMVAPGSNIPSLVPGGYAKASGASMGAPHVSGAAAVLRCTGFNKEATVERLLATADDVGEPGKDLVYGSGRLNVARAVEGRSAQWCIVPGLGAASGESGSQRRSSGNRGPTRPAATAIGTASPASSPLPSPVESARAEAFGGRSRDEDNLALLAMFVTSAIALFVWNYWRTSRS